MLRGEKLTRFNKWLDELDAACIAKCDMSYRDLPDCRYLDWFEEGVSPRAAANRAIKNAKDEGDY